MNKIYYKAPIVAQHIFTSLYGYKLKIERYNNHYKKAYRSFINNNQNQSKLLQNLLVHLKQNIPYYKNIKIESNDPFSSLLELDFTYKDNLRKELEQRSYLTDDVGSLKTGGTTGKSLKVYSSKEDIAKRMAYLDYIKFQNGVKPFSKRASFTGKEITPNKHKRILWRYNIPMNQILYASFKLNKENVKYIFRNMEKRKPVSIDGFPSSIHLVAKYILINKININWNVRAIFPTAETLTSNMKEDIEKAFKTKVIDQYASSEGAPFIYTGHNNKYQIGHETGLFEFYKSGSNTYDMVVTSFINFATPIIRYKIGDQVKIESNKNYLNSFNDEVKIEKIIGRSTDFLIGNNDNKVTSVNLANSIKDLGNKIIQSQFIQKKHGVFIVNLIVSKDFSINKDEQILINKLNHRLGNNNQYVFNYVEEINKEKSGKTRFIINEMSDI